MRVISTAVALCLAGSVVVATTGASGVGAATAVLGEFSFSGGAQTFTVPAGVDCVRIDGHGAQGGEGENPDGGRAPGGLGGQATAEVQVTPGEVLQVNVGGAGSGSDGGFNGGADGGDADEEDGGGGGGASDVRRSPYGLTDRLVVAGGGGGGGGDADDGGGQGGSGGGLVGGDGADSVDDDGELPTPGGGGGTQTQGGTAPTAFDPTAMPGTLGQGGRGGVGVSVDDAGGGGGGGYYGGGGGAGEDDDVPSDEGGGGGGGSGFGPVGVTFQTGVRAGDGSVVISRCFETAEFDWTVPERFGFDHDGDGMVDYYPPSGSLVIEPGEWQVDFTHGDPATCDTSLYREWAIDGHQVVAGDPAIVFLNPYECEFSYKFPDEGTYDVELLVSDAPPGTGGVPVAAAVTSVVVQDWLIVSLGDSVASGEGNPDLPITPTRSQETWQSQRCHRSADAGPAEAARNIENADPKTSVTFVHLACSGADIVNGLLRSYRGIEWPTPEPRPPAQIDQIRQLIPNREIDAITISIGANDIQFSDTLVDCMIWADCHTGSAARRFTRLANALPSRYQSLASLMDTALPDVPDDRVYLTEYYDPTRYDDFSVCGAEPPAVPTDPVLHDFPIANRLGLGISQAEANWASQTMLPTLNALIQAASTTHGWNYIGGIYPLYLNHGYCASDSWIVTYTASQQDQDDRFGTIHPNRLGHFVYANKIKERATEDFYDQGDLNKPRSPLPNP